MIATSTATNIVLAVLLVAAVAAWLLVRNAPEGYEDTDGFHLGRPDKPPEELMLDELVLHDELDRIHRPDHGSTRPGPTTRSPIPGGHDES